MKRSGFLLTASAMLIGCFKDEPKLPQYYANQEIDVAVDSVICYSTYEDFDQFLIICSDEYDSLHWFTGYLFQDFLGNQDTLNLPNDPYGFEAIRCRRFLNGLITEYELELNYCVHHMYIPTAFSPMGEDGLNDTWRPTYYQTIPDNELVPFSIHWEIRSLDGTKVFETDDYSHPGWDGTYNGHLMPRGSYLGSAEKSKQLY